ncbi:AraC family transcriptional regulator [Ohessyouella blattaphilus]|uniref:AraC family transcriptional regulator n=1 Tax=Ohessyouella blattaphilus TaxID=2949333 RepID=A0ABT1EG35_9FIRM|nr:AraC family transcriptional regulator [Ohessyouella blattaphilus]MCP1109672.1 AraC family transcriptional regulator [Ohessyouella blattaphilus]MCR8563066.1 AraC family transcriptional regulator [Ohessyouella blattaphilus]
MSKYLEIPAFDQDISFRTFLHDGMEITYPHFHKEIEIIYILKGRLNIGVRDEIIELQKGEVYFFASGEPHFFLASPGSERYVWQFDLKIFNETLLGKDLESLFELFEKSEPCSRSWSKDFTEKFIHLLTEAYNALEEKKKGYNYYITGLLNQVIGLMYQQVPIRATTKKQKKSYEMKYKETLDQLNIIFDFVEKHYDEPLTLDEVSAKIGFSPHYFTRFFKKNTGQTFMQFLTEYRIIQSKFLLANDKLPMVDVAERAGFSSVKTFHHVFKKQVGLSPLKYSKKMKE